MFVPCVRMHLSDDDSFTIQSSSTLSSSQAPGFFLWAWAVRSRNSGYARTWTTCRGSGFASVSAARSMSSRVPCAARPGYFDNFIWNGSTA